MHSEAAFEATEVAQFYETLSDGEFLVALQYLFHFYLQLNASLDY